MGKKTKHSQLAALHRVQGIASREFWAEAKRLGFWDGTTCGVTATIDGGELLFTEPDDKRCERCGKHG